MQLTAEDKSWILYVLKIGIVAGLFIGAGLYLVAENATPQFFIIGVIGIVMGIIFVVGAYGTWMGLTKESLDHMSLKIIDDSKKF